MEHHHRWKSTLKAFWQCLAVFVALLTLTVIAHVRPDWIATALGSATFCAFIILAIGAQELWEIKRNPFA